MEDPGAVYAAFAALAHGDTWPNWYANNPFRATRETMMQAKAAPAAT